MLEYPSPPPPPLNSMQISESIMNGNALSSAGAAAAAAALLNDSPSVAPPTAAAAVTPSSSSAPSTPAQLPQALQNLQRLLQSQLANVSPLHLQQALQRQQQLQMADNGRKQLEQMMQSLQEQLQINLLQQTHLGSGPGKPSASAIQQLQQQQQQLVAQMQMTQQALMMGNSLESAHKDSSPTSGSGVGLSRSRERHMSETFGSTGSSDGSLKENRPDNNNGVKTEINGGRERHSSGVGSKRCTSPSSSPSGGGGGGAGGSSFSSSSSGHSSAPTEKLFSHGHCHWPGCDASCHDLVHFHRHLSEAHLPDDRSTAQTRVQAQIVSQLELQLAKERDRLGAMMRHLNLEMRGGEVKERSRETTISSLPPPSHSSPLSSYNPYLLDRTPTSDRRSPQSLPPPPPRSPSPKRIKRDSPERPPLPAFTLPTSLAAGLGPLPPRLGSSLPVLPPSFASLQPNQPSPLSALTAAVRSPLLSTSTPSSPLPTSPSPANSIGGVGPIRPKPASSLIDTPRTPVPLPLPHGFDERRGRGDRGNPNLDPAMDIKLNRTFYAENDVRPPYTYAALIRYAIRETSDQQLTLHEIYNWFTTTFMYFRRNAASWKNAVRHNLSLHKCFMRVENVKGAVWTVDDDEYHRRRPPRGVQGTSSSASASASASPTLTPQTPSLIDTNLSSMLAAASPEGRAAFFNQAAIVEQMRRSGGFPDMKAMAAAAAAAAAAAVATTSASNSAGNNGASSGLESPPASLDNRSTPGSLDLSRVKGDTDSPPPSLVPPPPSALFMPDKQEQEEEEEEEDSKSPVAKQERSADMDEDAMEQQRLLLLRRRPEEDEQDNLAQRSSPAGDEKDRVAAEEEESTTTVEHPHAEGNGYVKVGQGDKEEEDGYSFSKADADNSNE